MPMRVSVTAGSLPPGLKILGTGDGRIVYLQGQARVGGSYNWTLTATDDEGSAKILGPPRRLGLPVENKGKVL